MHCKYKEVSIHRQVERGMEEVDKGQRSGVLHSPYFLKRQNLRSRLNHITGDQRGGTVTGCQEKHFSFLMQTNYFPPAQGQSLPEEKEAPCVLGEEMLTLALILKGPGRSIALSSLRKTEINMFLKATQAACGVCVWASLIPPDAFSEKPEFLKKDYHISRSSGFISNT